MHLSVRTHSAIRRFARTKTVPIKAGKSKNVNMYRFISSSKGVQDPEKHIPVCHSESEQESKIVSCSLRKSDFVKLYVCILAFCVVFREIASMQK